MSDMYDPYSSPSTDEMMQMLAQYGSGAGNTLPGKTPAQQLNYFQDLVSSLGFDPVKEFGNQGDFQAAPFEQYVPPISKARAVYGQNPVYGGMMDLIDQGADPDSAFRTIAAQYKDDKSVDIKWDDPDVKTQLTGIASQYAYDNVAAVQSEQQYMADKAKYEAASGGSGYGGGADAQKYRGPRGVFDTASEYDLMGAPSVDDLISEYAAAGGNVSRQKRPTTVVPPQVGGWNGSPGQSSHASSRTKDSESAIWSSIKNGGQGAILDMSGPAAYAADLIKSPNRSNIVGGRKGSPGQSSQANREPLFVGGDAGVDAKVRGSLEKRLERSKSTRVRSEANEQAMRTALALRTFIGA